VIENYKVVVVLPAFNAGRTLALTYSEIPFDIVDEVVLVDDCSNDETSEVARRLGIQHVIEHPKNLGYGGNQKTCYRKALDLNADIVVMIHPDYQYTPKLVPSMVSLISQGLYQVVLGSRILGNGALKGGMPLYKYVANRLLTVFENIVIGAKLSEYHTGYRAFSREALESINFSSNSDDFIFDNQMLSQVIYAGYEIGEITCPTKYFGEASSISFRRSVKYGLGVIVTALMHLLQRIGLAEFEIYQPPDGNQGGRQ